MSRLSLILIMLLLAACSFERNKMNDGEGGGAGVQNKLVSYALVQQTIFQPKCVGCHSGKNAPDLSSYENVVAHLAAVREQAIVLKKMPKKQPLSAGDIALLQAWIDSGAPKEAPTANQPGNPPTDEPGPPTPPGQPRAVVRWPEVNEKIIKTYCTSCHSVGNPDGLSSYEDIDSVRSTIGTVYFAVAITSTMPPAPPDWPEDQPNKNQLSRELKDLLSQWIADGMPDAELPEGVNL